MSKIQSENLKVGKEIYMSLPVFDSGNIYGNGHFYKTLQEIKESYKKSGIAHNERFIKIKITEEFKADLIVQPVDNTQE